MLKHYHSHQVKLAEKDEHEQVIDISKIISMQSSKQKLSTLTDSTPAPNQLLEALCCFYKRYNVECHCPMQVNIKNNVLRRFVYLH
jgi:hypothetical protein